MHFLKVAVAKTGVLQQPRSIRVLSQLRNAKKFKIFYTQSMWDFFELKNNQWYRWDLNGASAFLQKVEDAWYVQFNQIPFRDLNDEFGGPYPVDAPAAENGAISFIVGKGKDAALRPYLSEIPYLVTVPDEIRIMPGAKIRFDVMLPPFLRFEVSAHEPPIAEAMPFVLSRTWFGDTSDGILCHSLPSLLVPRYDGNSISLSNAEDAAVKMEPNTQSFIHCELSLHNTSRTPIDFNQAVIDTDMLNVYEKDGRLVTDEIVLDSLNDGTFRMGIHHGQKKRYKKLSSSVNGCKSEVLLQRGVEFVKNMTSI